MPYLIEIVIPATNKQECHVQIPPDATVDQVAAELRKIEIPTDPSVLSPELRAVTANFPRKLGAAVSRAVATTWGRPIRIGLKPIAADGDASPSQDLCSLHTGGLWLRVSDRGRVVVTNETTIAQENPNKAMLRFLDLLLDLANGRRPLPSAAELKAMALAQISAVAGASDARAKLLVARHGQKPPRN